MFYVKCLNNPCGSVRNMYAAKNGEYYGWSALKEKADLFNSNEAFRRREREAIPHIYCGCEFIVEQAELF